MSSSHNSEEEISSHSTEVLENANKRIREAFDMLNCETKRIRTELEAYDKAAKKLEQVHFSKIIKLNVGGHHFSTSLETLTKDPDSMLHAMFSGRFETKPSEDGSYFIDRDGTHFRYILNYLRAGQLVVPEDKIVQQELLTEAEFYQVEGIIKTLTPRPFKDSVILSSDQCKTLIDWLKETRALTDDSGNLLYRASCDGWSAANFHACCDNKGATLTVVKSGNYIFGGYTEEHWNGSDCYVSAPDSFLFSLVNTTGLPPTKLPLKAEQEESAIYCYSGYGPVFGGGHDLYIVNAPNSNNCSSRLNFSYQCPRGQDPDMFLAGINFRVIEMEVFGFEM